MSLTYYNPVPYTGSAEQEAVKRAVGSAIDSFSSVPPPSPPTPLAFTQAIARQLLGAMPEARAAILNDAEYFVATHGLYVFGEPYYVSLPIVAVKDGCRLIDHSATPPAHLRDKAGREVIFTRVTLGRPHQEGHGAARVRGAYARGCMFLVTGSFGEQSHFRWTIARGLLALFSMGIQDHQEAVDTLVRLPTPKDPALYLLGHHLCRTILKKDTSYDLHVAEPPPVFLEWCEEDMTQQLMYHEIGGHYVQDLMQDQTSKWRPDVVPLAEARAQLCEIAYGEHPLVGLYDLFNRRDADAEHAEAFSLAMSRLVAAGAWTSQASVSADNGAIVAKLILMTNDELRTVGMNALNALDRSL